ncbi:hypothetical protein S40288_10871 [Stachybotrys chartarum IBT 40288]|nr:hypothetical protein S40288_10871 [Stachybotrys chartarum IBT 40288]
MEPQVPSRPQMRKRQLTSKPHRAADRGVNGDLAAILIGRVRTSLPNHNADQLIRCKVVGTFGNLASAVFSFSSPFEVVAA